MLGLIYSLFFLAVVLDALGDAFRATHRQVLHHLMESLMVLNFILFLFIGYLAGGGNIVLNNIIISSNDYINTAHLIMSVLFYVSFRFVFFDLIYNLVTKQPLGYIGTKGSSLYVNILYWIAEKTKSGIGFTVTLIKGFGFMFLVYTILILVNWYI